LDQDNTVTEQLPRGLCYHEVGHAVVAWFYGLPVFAVRVEFSEERGWHGGADVPFGAASRLALFDQVTIYAAGKAAEEVYECPAHARSWSVDLGEIAGLLTDAGMHENKHWPYIIEAKKNARSVPETHRQSAFKLIDQLVEYHHIDQSSFLRLMNDKTPNSI
jgi:ATP-dependent Zn protease